MAKDKEPTVEDALKQLDSLNEESLISGEDMNNIMKNMKNQKQKAAELDKKLKKK